MDRLQALANMARKDSGATEGERNNALSLLKKLTPLIPSQPEPQEIDIPDPRLNGWAYKVFNAVENLVWMQDKGWRTKGIHIQQDLCDKLDVPNSVIRDIVEGMLTDQYPALRKRFIRGSQ